MDGAEYLKHLKRLRYSPSEACAAFNIDRATEWRWRQRGCEGPAEELVRVHVVLQEMHRTIGRLSQGITLSGRNWEKASKRVRTNETESARGEVPGALRAKPRKRRAKADDQHLIELTTADYLKRGGKITKV